MTCRGIRGAITVEANTELAIVDATTELLTTLFFKNTVEIPDIVSIFFSATPDLNAAFPALAARQMTLDQTPLMCCQEIDVPGGLNMCIRVLVHVNSQTPIHDIQHVYLKDAVQLRPDIVS